MEDQAKWGKTKNGGYHEVSDRMTSAVQFQTEPFKSSLCLKATMHLWWKKTSGGSGQPQPNPQTLTQSLLSSLVVCFLLEAAIFGSKTVLNLNILLQFSTTHWVSTIRFGCVLIYCNTEQLFSQLYLLWSKHNDHYAAVWQLKYKTECFCNMVHKTTSKTESSNSDFTNDWDCLKARQQKQQSLLQTGQKKNKLKWPTTTTRHKSLSTIGELLANRPGHTRRQDRRIHLHIGDIRILMT